MKCCACDKELSVECQEVPPTWFGKFKGDKMVKGIHAECVKKPENKSWWEGE